MTEIVSPDSFEELIEYIRQTRAFDFTGYKRASLQRRIDKRLRMVGFNDYEEYRDYLEAHPQEFVALFNTILINVTAFFRDVATWAHLRDSVLPKHLDALGPDRPIRAWSAGCASGEETYTLAMVLCELLGEADFKSRVKVYGTDVDDEALAIARHASYSDHDVASVPAELRERYFEVTNGKYSFRTDLRRSVIFGRLDVLHDAPISRLEMLVSRNMLMYFNAEAQARVLERFHFALNNGGIMVLGKAETMLSHSDLFESIDRRRRIFRKVPTPHGRERPMDRFPLLEQSSDRALMLKASGFETAPTPAIFVDAEGYLVAANERARIAFDLPREGAAPLLQDLELSYRPIELRAPIAQSYVNRDRVRLSHVPWNLDDATYSVDVEIVPLYSGDRAIGVCIYFIDLTQERGLEELLARSSEELEQAYQEAQSANEELETTNEELQSTNEELETMNEELQSTNDELHAVNDEVRVRSEEVTQLNSFLQAILTSLRGGVAVVDRRRRVRIWNPRAEDLWGVREEEVRGMDFTTIDIGLPVADLAAPLDECLSGKADLREVHVDAVTRRGRAVSCRVAITPLLDGNAMDGAILVMDITENSA